MLAKVPFSGSLLSNFRGIGRGKMETSGRCPYTTPSKITFSSSWPTGGSVGHSCPTCSSHLQPVFWFLLLYKKSVVRKQDVFSSRKVTQTRQEIYQHSWQMGFHAPAASHNFRRTHLCCVNVDGVEVCWNQGTKHEEKPSHACAKGEAAWSKELVSLNSDQQRHNLMYSLW